jgi:hypothetical protein
MVDIKPSVNHKAETNQYLNIPCDTRWAWTTIPAILSQDSILDMQGAQSVHS